MNDDCQEEGTRDQLLRGEMVVTLGSARTGHLTLGHQVTRPLYLQLQFERRLLLSTFINMDSSQMPKHLAHSKGLCGIHTIHACSTYGAHSSNRQRES